MKISTIIFILLMSSVSFGHSQKYEGDDIKRAFNKYELLKCHQASLLQAIRETIVEEVVLDRASKFEESDKLQQERYKMEDWYRELRPIANDYVLLTLFGNGYSSVNTSSLSSDALNRIKKVLVLDTNGFYRCQQ